MRSTFRALALSGLSILAGACDFLPQIFVSTAELPVTRTLDPLTESARDEKGALSEAGLRTNATFLFLLAQQYSERGREDEAIAVYRRLLELDETAAHVHFLMGQEIVKKGEYEIGLASIKRAFELEPTNTDVRLFYGQLLSSLKEHSEALVVLGELAEQDPSNEEVLSILVDIEMERGDFVPARRRLDKHLAANADSEFAHFKLGRVHRELGNLALARKHFEKALELAPTYYQAGTYLAIIKEEANDMKGALEMYSWLAHATNGALYHRKVAAMHLKNQDFAKALEAFENLIRVEPTDTKTRIYVARLLIEMGKIDQARDTLRDLVKMDPSNGSLRIMLGMILETQDKLDDALTEYAKVDLDSTAYVEAVKMRLSALRKLQRTAEIDQLLVGAVAHAEKTEDADRSEALFEVSAYYAVDLKDVERAHVLLDRALKRFPESANLLYQKGMVFERESRSDEGIRVMQKILEKHPEHAGALNFIGYSWAEKGERLEEAESHIRRALKLKPDDPYVMDSLGWVLYKQGKNEEAYEVLYKSYKLRPDESVIADHLGDVLVKMGRLGEAMAYYEKALNLGPEKESDRNKIRSKLSSLRDSKDAEPYARRAPLDDSCHGMANRRCVVRVFDEQARQPAASQ
jgi:tetratricopeptide (TPR) repeat protein